MEKSWEEVCSLRSRLYGFMGNCLLESVPGEGAWYVQREFWEQFPLAVANPKMEGGLAKIIGCTGYLEKLPTPQACRELQLEFTRLFIGPGQPQAPPWESFYRTPEKLLFAWPAFQVREAYRQEGLEITRKYQLPEDHMGLELMFLATVSDALTKLLPEKGNQLCIAAIIQRQVDFITSHPLEWIADFFNDANSKDTLGFYSGLIELIWGIFLWDLELLQEMLER